MALITPDDAESRILEYIINRTSPSNLTMKLYTNEIDLVLEEFVSSDFTECTEAGYGSFALVSADWTINNTLGILAATYNSSVIFIFTEEVTVYGYYIVNASGAIMFAEEFPNAPVVMPFGGGQISVRPQIQLN